MTAPNRSSRWRNRLERFAPPLLTGALPATLLSVGVAWFVLNHFFVHAPYLLDSGWYSAIVYHAGVFPDNPQIACNYAEWYYGIHVSPLVSLFSVLSYASPLPRIEWYALFEALVFLPIGLATYAVSSRLAPARALYRLPITLIAALAFAFSGQVMMMVNYPHYEAAIPGLICLVLAGVVTGRPRFAWTMLVLAVCVREDAGLHTALALAPVLYLKWRGVELTASLRTLVKMVAFALLASVIAIAAQKLFCRPANLLRIEYLGAPPLAHLSWSTLGERAILFLESCQVFWYPFAATCLIAALRRDPRYLLGWVAAVPWFTLNFLAVAETKSTFTAYTGFPFLVSVFWVYVYGAWLAPAQRRLHAGVIEALFALVCLSSTLALQSSEQWWSKIYRDMRVRHRMDRAAVHGFAEVLARPRASFGRLYVDYAVAAIAIESLQLDDLWRAGAPEIDAIAFHRDTAWRDGIVADLIAKQLDVCTTIARTRFLVCSRAPLPPGTFGDLETRVVRRDSLFR